MLLRREMFHDFHEIADHLLPYSPNQRRALGSNADHHFAPILSRNRPNDIAQVFKPRHQAAGRRRGVPHFLRDGRHGQHFLLVEISEQEKLREGNVSRRQLLAQMEHEAALHLEHDSGKAFSVGTEFVGWSLCKRGGGSGIQGLLS